MADSEGEGVMRHTLPKNEEDALLTHEGAADAAAESSAIDHEGVEEEKNGDEEPSGESLQGDGAGNDDDDSDGSGGSINEFVVDDEEDDADDGYDPKSDGVDDAPIEVDANLRRKKMKRRRKRFDSEIQEEAEELLATGGKNHRVRIGHAAVDDGKASKAPGEESPAVSVSVKPEKGARSIDLKCKEEEDDENHRDYTNAFVSDFFGQEAEETMMDAKQPMPRVVDPMDELESYQTAEDKLAIAADIPERIFDALPAGKVPLKGMDDWQQTIAPQVVAHELKRIAVYLSSGNFDGNGNRHLGFEHIIKFKHKKSKHFFDDVFKATVDVATHIGVHLREPPFIRRYLSSCYSSVLHHEALWYIFDRVMDSTLLVKNAAECIKLMETYYSQNDPFFQEVETLLKDAPQVLTETLVFDLRHHVHIMKYDEALAAGAVSPLSTSDPNFHIGVRKQEVHAFLASFTLPAHLIMPCINGEQTHAVETPSGRFADLLEPLVSLLARRNSEQTERVVVATASKIIAADLRFRQHVREQLKNVVYMTITVTPEGFNSREVFHVGEHFKNQSLEDKIAHGVYIDFRDLFDDPGQGEHLRPSEIWDKAPSQLLAKYHGYSVCTQDYTPAHLAQWFRLEKQGLVQLEFKCQDDPSDPSSAGGTVLGRLKQQVNAVYLDLNLDLEHEFNVVRSKILNVVLHKLLIPLIVREQKEAATSRTRSYVQIQLYRSYRTKLAFPPLQPPSESKLQVPKGGFPQDQVENFKIPKIMTVCHSRVGCDPHFVISTVGADGSDPMVVDHFSHQKRRLRAGAMSKHDDVSSAILRSDLELKQKLDQSMDRYGNVYAIVVGCHNLSTHELFRFLDEYMSEVRHMRGSVYYFDEHVSQLVANGKKHAHGEAYLVAESLARFVVDPSSEASKLFAARERPLIFKLNVHREQSMISTARRRDIAARVIVDHLSTGKHPVSYKIFSALPEQARLLLQFIPGLGPRKARLLSDQLCGNRNGLQTREDLKCQLGSVPMIGQVVFMNCAGFLAGSGQVRSDRDIDDVSNLLRECTTLERTYVHPLFYGLALEIAQLKTKKKGAAAISAFRREGEPPILSPQELKTILETTTSATLVQEFLLGRNNEAQDLIKAICRAMHEYRGEAPCVAFAPMPLHIVFEKLIGFKPHELLFTKTSAAIIQKQADSTRIRVHVQGPEMDGSMFELDCEKERDRSLADVFNGVDVIHCVITGVNMRSFSFGIGNRKWMMAMHEITNPELRSQVLPTIPKDPADTVIRSRLSSLPWFKNISVNEAKQAAKSLGANRYIACPDVLIHRISLFVCFSPEIAGQFYIDEVKWDHSKPSIIGTPLRIGSGRHSQHFDELAEVEARFIMPLIAKKEEVVAHFMYLKMTAAEAESRCTVHHKTPWAIIAHEDKPGVFKFVWNSYCQFRHVSFLVVNNGFFFDDNLFPQLSDLLRRIQALIQEYPGPMHPSAPAFSVTLDAQLLQLTIPLASLPLKLHPILCMAKGSLMQLSQTSALVSESLIPRGRADLSAVIAFVSLNILPTPQNTSTKAKDFAWFALRPVSGAHVSIQSTMLLRQRVPFMVELMSMMVSQNKAYVLLNNQDVLGYLMPTVPALRAMMTPDAVQYADDAPADSSASARSLVLVIMDLRVAKPPPQQQPMQAQYRTENRYQLPAQPTSAHGGWNGFGHAPPVHSSHQVPSTAHGYTPSFGPPMQGSVLSQCGQPRQALPLPPVPSFHHQPHHASPSDFSEGWRGGASNVGWAASAAPPPHNRPPAHNSGGQQGWTNRRY